MPVIDKPFALKTTKRLTDQELLDIIKDYQQESRSVWTEYVDGERSIQDLWQLSKRMYYGDQVDDKISGIENPVINRTQNSVNSTTAAQTERTPSMEFTPGSTLGDTVFQMSQGGSQLIQMDRSTFKPGEGLFDTATGQLILNMDQVLGKEMIPEIIAQLLIEGGTKLQQDHLLPVNSSTASELLQRAYDAEWKQMKGDIYLRRNVLQNNIFGHQPLFYQWSREFSKGVLENPPIKAVLPDPIQVDVDRFRFLIFNFLLSVDEAEQRYPDKKSDIKEAAMTGRFDTLFSDGSSGPSVWSNTQFNRPMVPVTVMWRRHVRYRMTEKEALRMEAVERGEDGQYHLTVTNGDEPGFTNRTLGDITHPLGDNWPTISHIEESHTIPNIDAVLKRGRCAYSEMPMAWNRNIHLIDRPYGISECARLYHIQRVINILMRSLMGIVEQYQFPPEVIPLSVYERMKAQGLDSRRVPRRIQLYSDEEIRELIPALQHLAQWAPPMPSAYVNLLQIALEEHDRMSGDVDVQQGDTPAGVQSGVAIQRLQAAARGPLGLKSADYEAMLERLADIIVDSMLKWMSPSHWMKYSNGYTAEGMAKLMEILDQREFTIKAEVSSGRGINAEVTKREAFEARRQGDLSRKTFLDIMKLVSSSDAELKRIVKEQAELLAQQMKAAQADPNAQTNDQQQQAGNAQPQQQKQGTPADTRN